MSEDDAVASGASPFTSGSVWGEVVGEEEAIDGEQPDQGRFNRMMLFPWWQIDETVEQDQECASHERYGRSQHDQYLRQVAKIGPAYSITPSNAYRGKLAARSAC